MDLSQFRDREDLKSSVDDMSLNQSKAKQCAGPLTSEDTTTEGREATAKTSEETLDNLDDT